MTALATLEVPMPATPPGDATVALVCRCGQRLGLASPGRLWMRHAGRTALLEGWRATVWCNRCSKQHVVDLTTNPPTLT